MNAHDYAGCPDPTCRLCESYGLGWSYGKAKMAAELLELASRPHHPNDCGCRPCGVIREILRRKGWRRPR